MNNATIPLWVLFQSNRLLGQWLLSERLRPRELAFMCVAAVAKDAPARAALHRSRRVGLTLDDTVYLLVSRQALAAELRLTHTAVTCRPLRHSAPADHARLVYVTRDAVATTLLRAETARGVGAVATWIGQLIAS